VHICTSLAEQLIISFNKIGCMPISSNLMKVVVLKPHWQSTMMDDISTVVCNSTKQRNN